MKKVIGVVVLVSIVAIISACVNTNGKTNEKSSETGEKQVNQQPQKVNVVADYLGECGYILSNQIFDYSKICETTYEYDSKVKLPFEQVEGTKLAYDEYGNPFISDVDESKLQAYTVSLNDAGYEVCELNDDEKQIFMAFGNNMRVTLHYYSDTKELRFFIYAGNVVGDRTVTIEDARKLIDDSKLLEESGAYSDYYVIAIDTESVRNNGYYEFLIFSKKQEFNWDEPLKTCYYMITDGKNINLFEDDIIHTEFPTNVNMDKDGNLIATILKSNGLSGNEATETYIRTYKFNSKTFEKEDEYNTNINLLNDRVVLSKCNNGKISFYELIRNENEYISNRHLWIVDKEYNKEN